MVLWAALHHAAARLALDAPTLRIVQPDILQRQLVAGPTLIAPVLRLPGIRAGHRKFAPSVIFKLYSENLK